MFEYYRRILSSCSCSSSSTSSTTSNNAAIQGDTNGMVYTLYINLLLFVLLMAFFEANRYIKQIYLSRWTTKFKVIFIEISLSVEPRVLRNPIYYMVGSKGFGSPTLS